MFIVQRLGAAFQSDNYEFQYFNDVCVTATSQALSTGILLELLR